jgi:hypothetical protein
MTIGCIFYLLYDLFSYLVTLNLMKTFLSSDKIYLIIAIMSLIDYANIAYTLKK